MKTSKLIILTLVLSFVQSCCPLFKIDCGDDCEDVQIGTELADLLLEDFESVIVPDDDEGSTLYNIIHTIVNFASDIDCPNAVPDADMHKDRLQLIYSENAGFSNPVVVETQDAEINQFTAANDDYSVVSTIQFETAGFYIIDNTIDNLNDVMERNESNNNDINSLGGSSRFKSEEYINRFIIHITDDMVSNRKNAEGKPIYISKWEIIIE